MSEEVEPEELRIHRSAEERREFEEKLRADVRRLWLDPALATVLGYVRAQIRSESERSLPHERELRDQRYYELHALKRVERRLSRFAAGGKLAEMDRVTVDGGNGSAA